MNTQALAQQSAEPAIHVRSAAVNSRALAILGVKKPRKHLTLDGVVTLVHAKVTYPMIEDMRKRLGMDQRSFARVLEISPSTYARRTAAAKGTSGKAAPAPEAPVAERALRVARVNALAEDVLEDVEAAREWMHRPQPGLAGRVPAELLASEFGAREVETLLHQIDEGVYV